MGPCRRLARIAPGVADGSGSAGRAYKLKKPLRLPFVDFSPLDARRRFCEEELRLNRRLAPSVYLDVVEVRDSARGPSFGGDGTVLDVR